MPFDVTVPRRTAWMSVGVGKSKPATPVEVDCTAGPRRPKMVPTGGGLPLKLKTRFVPFTPATAGPLMLIGVGVTGAGVTGAGVTGAPVCIPPPPPPPQAHNERLNAATAAARCNVIRIPQPSLL